MTDSTTVAEQQPTTTQVFGIYIDAPIEKVWAAITSSEFNEKYGYGGALEMDLRPGGHYRNLCSPRLKAKGHQDVVISGTVIEVDPPHLLVLDWQAAWQDEPPSRLSWHLQAGSSGLTRVTLTHDLPHSPRTAAEVGGNGAVEQGGGGWPWVLSSLKTLLETGRTMTTAG